MDIREGGREREREGGREKGREGGREREREMNLTGSSTRSKRCGCSPNCLPSTAVALA